MASRDKNPSENRPRDKGEAPRKEGGVIIAIRDWLDAIIIAYLLAMFIRLFVVELFKIPSPSMTPALLGTESDRQVLSYYDIDHDGKDDMILRSYRAGLTYDVYLSKPGYYQYAGAFDPGPSRDVWMRQSQQRQDHILVSKFSFWFSPPDRGDIVVFKVPRVIFEPEKPIYIKRVVGLPGEDLTFQPVTGVPGNYNTMGRLVADGELVEQPAFFQRQLYQFRAIGSILPHERPDYAEYRRGIQGLDLLKADVPDDGVYVFGDNTVSSKDSRYWGDVPLTRLRGKAICRYSLWPPRLDFLH